MAISAGFAAAIAGVALLGPSLVDVFAEEQDQRAIYMNIMAGDHAQRRAAMPQPMMRAAAPQPMMRVATRQPMMRDAPAVNALRALFGATRADRIPPPPLPPTVRAYAPMPRLEGSPTARQVSPRRDRIAAAALVDTDVGGGGLTRRSVCVRLCDGFAFPLANYNGEADNAGHSAICAGMCPGAPTRLYVAEAGSDNLSEARSTRDGKPYAALPVAFRYTTVRDDTCSCHAIGESQSKNVSLLRDLTLRQGDRVMTPRGFRVFRGSAGWNHTAGDFTPLSASHLARREYGVLAAMERASHIQSHPDQPARAARGNATPVDARAPSAEKAVRLLGPAIYGQDSATRISALP